MIKIENVEIFGWQAAIRGMRNPLNSWEKSDSFESEIGDNDCSLMEKLAVAGSDHRKFMRMINVTMDITAPLYWWAECDTYKVGTVRNSCSKMHKLLSKPFEMSDFSFDKLAGYKNEVKQFVDTLNELRDSYLNCDDEEQKKIIWYSILQLLPESYNQRATVQLNYEVLHNIYFARKSHKLDEWRMFCKWIEQLQLSKLIIGGTEK